MREIWGLGSRRIVVALGGNAGIRGSPIPFLRIAGLFGDGCGADMSLR